MSLQSLIKVLKGGAGSGNWGHAGRQGKRGGSAPKSGVGAALSLRTGRDAAERQHVAQLGDATKNLSGFDNITADFTDENRSNTAYLRADLQADYPNHTTVGNLEVDDPTVEYLASEAGVKPELIVHIASDWNGSSQSTLGRAMQIAVADELGVGLSNYQQTEKMYGNNYLIDKKNVLNRLTGGGYENLFNTPHTPENIETQLRNAARATYEFTQAELKARGISHVVAYRGFSADYGEKIHSANLGDTVKVNQNSISSWSLSATTATGFGNTQIAAKVPVERVFSFWGSGNGTYFESEFVIMGGADNFEAKVYGNNNISWSDTNDFTNFIPS